MFEKDPQKKMQELRKRHAKLNQSLRQTEDAIIAETRKAKPNQWALERMGKKCQALNGVLDSLERQLKELE